MSIVLKDKIKVNKNFIDDLITKGWQESENLQNQIDSIKLDSVVATKIVKLLKDLLTSYYVFTGCLENIGNEPIDTIKTETLAVIPEVPKAIPEEPVYKVPPKVDTLPELDDATENEPFEYFVDFDEPTGEPLTDDDLYN